MWEPSGISSSNNSNSNRSVVVLVTTLSACVLVYKAWGPLLIITCALVLVVHTCYSLLVNDSLFAPHTLVLLRYAKDFGLELILTLKLLFALGCEKSAKTIDFLKRRYKEGNKKRFNEFSGSPGIQEEEMNGGQRNAYRLSTMSIDCGEHSSPINHDPYHSFALNGACDGARTSTPLPRGVTRRKGMHPNGDLGQFIPISIFSPTKPSSLQNENKKPTITLPRSEETLYSPKGSPWGNSISPKMRDKTANVKTVQTVAGPLLASTRYNIDPKIYTDVGSPGLTVRLTKYAAEANNKLTHQPQYATGQFPKVNLYASPTPLLSPKIARARIPVTVRVAPPEVVNYSILDSHTHQERPKLFSNNSSAELKESTSCSSIDPVLKKISLKRHASREDMLDLAKKQRAEKMYYGQLENLEEMMQKRARDESITSEDDLSPQSKTQRPSKRSKASSCHDILHSLSSSLNVFSGVKRKAIDTSRCNTPDIEKHFKPSTKSPDISSFKKHPEKEVTISKEQLNVKVSIANASGEPHQHKKEEKCLEDPKTNELSQENQQMHLSNELNYPTPNVSKTNPITPRDSKLTDKLFMRPEPQTNEKLKILIEEQGNVEAKFTTDDKDEIKKQDIVNMRQNSMRLRLQSMFDAISGKTANKIDPDVVIQAEEINPPTSSNYTSLSSMTLTTTVNASPIATTIVPILKSDTESKSPTTKHVTFDLPVSSGSSADSGTSVTSLANKVSSAKQPEPIPLGKEAPSFGGFKNSTPSLAFNFGSASIPSVASDSSKSDTTNCLMRPSIEHNSTPSTIATTSNNSISTVSISTSSNVQLKNNTSVTDSSAPIISTPITSSSEFMPGFVVTTIPSTNSEPVVTFAPYVPINVNNNEQKTNVTTTTTATKIYYPKTNFKSYDPSSNVYPKQPTIVYPNETGPAGFKFGATTSSSTSVFSSTTIAATLATPTFTFGVPAKSTTTNFSFGSTVPSTVTTGFGVDAEALSTSASASASTIFVAPTTSMISSVVTAAPTTPAFGNSTPLLFGANNSSSLFSGSSNSTPTTIFKPLSTTTSTTTASIFSSQSNISTFGTLTPTSLTSTSTPTQTTPVTTMTTTSSLFGNTALIKPTTTSTIPSFFGNVAATTTTTPRPAFGESTHGQMHQEQQSNIFSGMSATTSGPSSIFGSTVAASTSGAPTLFSGSNNAAQNTTNSVSTSNPVDNKGIFDQPKSPSSMTFGTTSPHFGQTKSVQSFVLPNDNGGSTSSTFQMGSSGGALPSFSTTSGHHSTSTPNTSIFGSAFGSTARGSSSSGSGNFGGQGNATTSTFGAVASSFSTATTSPFGGQATTNQAPNLFGNVTAPTATSFSFGAAQPQQQSQPQQPSTSFSFGGSTNAGIASTGGLFQFGGTTNKPAGFNFNASTVTPSINFTGSATPTFNAGVPQGRPPAFNTPPTNMFSIGTSSSTPRSRTSRQRRQR